MPLDRATLSAIGHAGLPFWSPAPAATLDALLDRLAPPRGAHVLDLGCGDGAMLAHVTRRLGGPGTGVDHDPGALALARRHEGTLRWIERLADLPVDAPPVDLLVAVGSVSPADLPGLPLHARAVLVGELVAVGSPVIPDLPHPGRQTLAAFGWTLVAEELLGEAVMSAYEAHWLANVRAWAETHPEVDLRGAIAAHETILAAGGLGFELTGWVAPR